MCSATDRQLFGDRPAVHRGSADDMTALELSTEKYESGDGSGEGVEGQTLSAAKILRGTGPTDSSLQQTPRLVTGC
jgi:hypothetical protein